MPGALRDDADHLSVPALLHSGSNQGCLVCFHPREKKPNVKCMVAAAGGLLVASINAHSTFVEYGLGSDSVIHL